jgi:hypothetical protein
MKLINEWTNNKEVVMVAGRIVPQRLVMALEMASAVQTPLPLPDMSSPSSSFANLSFIMSVSGENQSDHTVRY